MVRCFPDLLSRLWRRFFGNQILTLKIALYSPGWGYGTCQATTITRWCRWSAYCPPRWRCCLHHVERGRSHSICNFRSQSRWYNQLWAANSAPFRLYRRSCAASYQNYQEWGDGSPRARLLVGCCPNSPQSLISCLLMYYMNSNQIKICRILHSISSLGQMKGISARLPNWLFQVTEADFPCLNVP